MGARICVRTADIELESGTESTRHAQADDLTAPLPGIGQRGNHPLGERWAVAVSGKRLFARFETADGLLFDLPVGADFGISSAVASGLAPNGVEQDIDARKNGRKAGLA